MIFMSLGRFSIFFWFSCLLVIHEFGHALIARYFDFHIKAITIYPFGGMTEFIEHENRSMLEEFLVLVSGPIFQQLGFLLFCQMGYQEDIFVMHYSLLCFNLLPMVPLDGSKLCNLCFERFVSFRGAKYVTSYISLGVCFLFAVLSIYSRFTIGMILSIYLIFQWIRDYRWIEKVVTKFLLERYLYSYHFKKQRIIFGMNPKKMYRGCSHLFYDGKTYHTEREILRKKFDLSRIL